MRVNPTAGKPLPESPGTRVRLDLFDHSKGLNRGRNRFIETGWYLTKILFFLSPFPWPTALKVFLLRLFGAKIGIGTVIKPRVNIHFPWRLTVGDHVWIGEEAFILNFEPVIIGNQVCLSQRVFLCTGNHDFRDPSFPYRNAPIQIGDGAWIGAQSFVAPGIKIGREAVATAGSIILKNLPPATICSGNPCTPAKSRWREPESGFSKSLQNS